MYYLTLFLNVHLVCHTMLIHLSCVRVCVTLWTIAFQAPLFMGLSGQEYWSRLPCPPPVTFDIYKSYNHSSLPFLIYFTTT